MENNRDFIEKLKQGNAQAFKKLVETHKDHVYNTCLGFLHQCEDAEDVAQEVFVQVYDSIESFRGDSSLGTWIYRIAVTKSLELIRYRKRKKRWAFFRSLMHPDNELDDISGEKHFQHPDLALEEKERAKILSKEIDKLSKNQRIAFVLHKMEGLSYKEIADVMETSLSAVESLMYRAKKNLRNQLHNYYQD